MNWDKFNELLALVFMLATVVFIAIAITMNTPVMWALAIAALVLSITYLIKM